MSNNYRAGFVGVVGFPNVGKSTLVNSIIGEKVSIVSAKPQTTRQRVHGILNTESSQVIFVDLPGVTERPGELNDFIREEFKSGVATCDAVLVVDDLTDRRKEKLLEFLNLAQIKKPITVVVNKSDAISGFQRDERIGFWRAFGFNTLYVSALKPEAPQIEAIMAELTKHLPESPAPLFDQELYTTQNMREIAREIVREKCFEVLHQEIPYGLGVKCLKFEETEGLTRIYVEVMVAKDNHKPMVVGAGGQNLKRIGQLARQELEKLIGNKVYLNVYVQSRPNWTKNKNLMKELGYVCEPRA